MKILNFDKYNENKIEDEKINGYEVEFFGKGERIYANIEIPSSNPTFDDDIQIKGFGKNKEAALKSLKSEYDRYKKNPSKYKTKF